MADGQDTGPIRTPHSGKFEITDWGNRAELWSRKKFFFQKFFFVFMGFPVPRSRILCYFHVISPFCEDIGNYFIIIILFFSYFSLILTPLTMDLFSLIPHINTSENAIEFLRQRGVLRSLPPRCPECQREMTEVSMGRRRHSGGDDKVWRCPTHKNKKESIRKGFLLFVFRSNHSFRLFSRE